MVSVERILEYSRLPAEGDAKRSIPVAKDWPQSGKISFEHVSLKYATDLPYVLHDVSLVINAAEKVFGIFNCYLRNKL